MGYSDDGLRFLKKGDYPPNSRTINGKRAPGWRQLGETVWAPGNKQRMPCRKWGAVCPELEAEAETAVRALGTVHTKGPVKAT